MRYPIASILKLNRFLPVAVSMLLAGCGGSSGIGVPDEGADQSSTTVLPAASAACAPGQPSVEATGAVAESDEKTYFLQPVEVGAGTQRVQVAYTWQDNGSSGGTPLTQTVIDLGLWDADGFLVPAGFRGWSGSRQGRIHADQDPVFVQSDSAERGYVPGEIEPGLWYVELGIAAVSPDGASWRIEMECLGTGGGVLAAADPVDSAHVADAAPGWYHGDFHMHAFHSNPNAPDWDDFIQQARDATLDFLMVTEYITGRHWETLGAVQRAHPDLLIWPGREIITYFGHVNTHGETPDVIEYRHGFMDVNIGDIQEAAKTAGALFQVNHPTIFPGPAFENFCRGCEFRLGGEIDWGMVDLIEIVNGPMLANSTDIGAPPFPGTIQNPFVQTAIDLWEEQLAAGHYIVPVSGSDSKGVDDPADRSRKGYGSSATAVFASELSRPALTSALQAGHVYLRTLGVAGSPQLELSVTTPGGLTGMFGDSFAADTATLEATVTGGSGQTLRYFQNGQQVLEVPVVSDSFVHSQPANRAAQEGPLGTFWSVQTWDPDQQVITTIGMPVFLTGP